TALAYYLISGTGSGGAIVAANTASLTLTPDYGAHVQLFPGGDGDIAFSISNSANVPATLTQIDLSAATIDSGVSQLVCGNQDFSLNNDSGGTKVWTTGVATQVVPANGTLVVVLHNAIHMVNNAFDQSGCAGAHLTVANAVASGKL